LVDRTQYIEYTENSYIDYKVKYRENEFFEDEWLGKDQSYISSLIESISADFDYKMNVDSNDMSLQYDYFIDAKLLITDKNSGNAYYTLEERISPVKTVILGERSDVDLKESVSIDYAKYDSIARKFIKAYGLHDSTSILTVTMTVNTDCSNEKFSNDCENTYTSTLNIPLAEDSFSIHSTQSAPANSVKSFEYKGFLNSHIFLTIAIIIASIAVLLFVGLLIFLHLTKNEDITYSARVRKILRAYSAFIQRIDGEFDSEGYQVVVIKTFNEMLGIRDTIQSPVLMFENADETMTRFFIPTNTKILYVYEIKVDNFDQIYAKAEEVEEEPIILEEVDSEELAEAIAQPDVELKEIEFIPDDDDQFEVAPEEPGIEVVGVVWPEKAKKNKVYRYDPNGEILEAGDIVLVPTMDRHQGKEVIRKVAVAHGNHRVDPEHIKHPLKKIIAVIRHSVTHSLTPNANEVIKAEEEEKAREEQPV
jgi:hypothetical protein